MLSLTQFAIDLTKERKPLERTAWSVFTKGNIYQLHYLENVALEKVQALMNLNYTNLFDNLLVVFKKNKFRQQNFQHGWKWHLHCP
jgi:hypothetical protein